MQRAGIHPKHYGFSLGTRRQMAHVLSLHPKRCQAQGRFAEPIILGSVLRSAYFLSVVWIQVSHFVVLVPLTSSEKSQIKNIDVIKPSCYEVLVLGKV